MSKGYTPDEIQVYSIREAVRLRPKMYFDKCFSEKALDAIPFEVLCHAFDEYFDGNCNKIQLTVWKDRFKVEYDTGIPLRKMQHHDLSHAEALMTKFMVCSNLKKHLAVGHEFCHLGMATINFASEVCELTSVWNNQKGVFLFKEGVTVSAQISAYEDSEQWTEIVVKPDKELFGELELTSKGVRKKTQEITKRFSDLTLTVQDEID